MDYEIDDRKSEYLNQVFEALSDSVRRQSLYVLREEGHADLDEITQALEPESEREANRIKSSLVHRHAPRLADFGLIDYDRNSNTLSYHDEDMRDERDEMLDKYLEQALGDEIEI